jgi:D-amino-acid oxidase
VRDVVRVEAQTLGGARLVHNYGHGGTGVGLSWGCAREVVALVAA